MAIKIALDVDNTLNKLSFYFLQTLEYDYGIDVGNLYESYKDNTFYSHYNLLKYMPHYMPRVDEKKANKIIEDIFGNYNFWINIPLISDKVVNCVEWLNTVYDINFVTYPYNYYDGSKRGKLDWIRKNFPFIRRKQVVFKDKQTEGTAPYDVVIDDNPHILENCAKEDRDIFIVKYQHGYNNYVQCDFILNKWDRYSVDIMIKKIENWDVARKYIHYNPTTNKWYFENEANCFEGQFDTKQEAVNALKEYCTRL